MRRLFSRKWLLATILVLAAMAVMVRLGIWQLDRLDTRRAFNAAVEAQVSQPELNLQGAALEAPLGEMEYRAVKVVGEYDHSRQIALRNQFLDNQLGAHLITPLHIAGSDKVVLVDRGWIPAQDFESGDWSKFDEPGLVEVQGVLRQSRNRADFGRLSDPTPAPGQQPTRSRYFVNIPAISQEFELPLLAAYIQQKPDPGRSSFPVRTQPELDLSEGPHMGYAIQWFSFAAILGIGYLVYLRRQESRKSTSTEESQTVDHREID
jgi:surfeit locus 1 family protein